MRAVNNTCLRIICVYSSSILIICGWFEFCYDVIDVLRFLTSFVLGLALCVNVIRSNQTNGLPKRNSNSKLNPTAKVELCFFPVGSKLILIKSEYTAYRIKISQLDQTGMLRCHELNWIYLWWKINYFNIPWSIMCSEYSTWL